MPPAPTNSRPIQKRKPTTAIATHLEEVEKAKARRKISAVSKQHFYRALR